MLGKNGFRVELDALNRKVAMAHAHNFIDTTVFILRPGGDFETVRQ